MLPTFLLPDAAGIEFEGVELDQAASELVLTLQTTAPQAACPLCHQVSQRVHSHYTRTLADVPCAALSVRWVLEVRRFFCHNPACARKIFTERLPTLAAPWARKTQRLQAVQSAIGIAVGGRLGAWLLKLLRMTTSVATLLRMIRKTLLPACPTPRVLGVDDWAKHKGLTYGTLLVDLERHQPVELLPDRQAATLADWLRKHPGVAIISRDRAGAYAEGAAQGAPNALQVADRWHLLKNLSDALSRVLERYRRALQHLTQPISPAEPLAELSVERNAPSPLSPAAAARARQRREQRYQRYQQVCALRQQGWTLGAIAQTTGLCRKTVSRWLRAEHLPELRRRRRPSRLDPYKPYLLQRWNEGCWTAAQLARELRVQGYAGGLTILRDFVRQLRQAQGLPPGQRTLALQHLAPEHLSRLTPLRAACLALGRPDQWREDEQALVERIRHLDPEVEAAVELTQVFARLIRQRLPEALDSWLERAAQSPSASLRAFATGVRRDYAAVKAAMTVEWSNGQVEGQVNRLKFIKRQMYGRAGFDLLRLRVLCPVRR